MQVASTLWPDIKSRKISEHRFRLKWTKCSPRTEANPLKTDSTLVFRQGQAQTSPTEEGWGRLAPLGSRPTTLVGRRPSRPHRLTPSMWQQLIGSPCQFCKEEAVAPCYKYKGVEIRTHKHTTLTSLLKFLFFLRSEISFIDQEEHYNQT